MLLKIQLHPHTRFQILKVTNISNIKSKVIDSNQEYKPRLVTNKSLLVAEEKRGPEFIYDLRWDPKQKRSRNR